MAGADICFVRGSVESVHAEMVAVAGGKNIWTMGGGDLAGLLDEAIIQVALITLGKGKPLFPRSVTSPPWQLLFVWRIGTGFLEFHYKLPGHSA